MSQSDDRRTIVRASSRLRGHLSGGPGQHDGQYQEKSGEHGVTKLLNQHRADQRLSQPVRISAQSADSLIDLFRPVDRLHGQNSKVGVISGSATTHSRSVERGAPLCREFESPYAATSNG